MPAKIPWMMQYPLKSFCNCQKTGIFYLFTINNVLTCEVSRHLRLLITLTMPAYLDSSLKTEPNSRFKQVVATKSAP